MESINVQELQIGSYLKYKGNVEVVTSIKSPSIDPKDENFGKWMVEIKQPYPVFAPLSDCEPIELTDEVLTYNLYFKNLNLKITSNEAFYCTPKGVVYGIIQKQGICYSNRAVKYLHELQMFKMSLTGSELIVAPF